MQNVMSAILQSVYTAFSRVHVTCHYSEGNMLAHFKFRKKKGLDLDQHRLFFMFRLRYTKYCSVLGLRISQIFRYDICIDSKILIFAISYDRFFPRSAYQSNLLI